MIFGAFYMAEWNPTNKIKKKFRDLEFIIIHNIKEKKKLILLENFVS